MSGLILPGRQRKPGLQIFVPDRYVDSPVVGHCHLCDARFYRGSEQAWQRHFKHCIAEHREEIEAESARRRESFFAEHPDPEYEAHMLKVGERMLREGRFTVKRNEV